MVSRSLDAPGTNQWPSSRARILIVTAAPAEAEAIRQAFSGIPAGGAARGTALAPWFAQPLNERISLLETGIGKVNAAAAVTYAVSPGRFDAVINLGICGSLPSSHPLTTHSAALSSVILASASVYADEGVQTPERFLDCASIGFPLGAGAFEGSAVPCSPDLLSRLSPLAQLIAPIATVSTCSGTDALAQSVAGRTGAAAEAMEGAAIGHVLARLYGRTPAFAELRVVSNTTGNRASQRWELKGALVRLTALARQLSDALTGAGSPTPE